MNDEFAQYRQKIDEIDDQLLSLIIERLAVVKKIGTLKTRLTLDVKDPDREAEIVNNLVEKVEGKLSKKQIDVVFKAIFKLSKGVQK